MWRFSFAPPLSSAHRRRLANAHCADVRLDKAHRVVIDNPAVTDPGAVDIDARLYQDFLTQERRLGHHEIRHLILDRANNKNDALFK